MAGPSSRVSRALLAEAVDLAKLHGHYEVNRALQTCAEAGRFGDGDLAQVLAHQQQTGELILLPARSEEKSLQNSTSAWKRFGR